MVRGVCYAFTLRQIEDDLEAPTAELFGLCMDLAAEISESPALMRRLGITDWAQSLVARSFRARDPHLYGRFDLAYDGAGPAKMLEFNADHAHRPDRDRSVPVALA